MKEELISFETAKLAKEKGFDVGCGCSYNEQKEQEINPYFYGNTFGNSLLNNSDFIESGDVNIEAPTRSLLQKWLRKYHGIYVYTEQEKIHNKLKFSFYIMNGEDSFLWDDLDDYHNEYEEALEKGLHKALKLIK